MRRALVVLGVTTLAAGLFTASAQASPPSIHHSGPAAHASAAGLMPVHITLPGRQFGPPKPL